MNSVALYMKFDCEPKSISLWCMPSAQVFNSTREFHAKIFKKGRNTKPTTKLANQNFSASVFNRAYFMPMSMRSHSTCQEINIYTQK